MKKYLIIVILGMLLPVALRAQQRPPEDPEKAAQELYENIQIQVEKFIELYKLDDVQAFYLDSIFVYNYTHMQDELNAMSKAKVSNTDLYISVQDAWEEKNYQAVCAILDDNQRAKYLKQGAARDKKARDKRMGKTK
ncbi:MAG: hypothetical protein IJU27_06360 [Bacteroidales bacterium]|nr:hypothetical protein [Bacteroidales bacterium]